MSDPTIRIAVNCMALSAKLPQGDSRWATFNDSFVNQSLSLIDIANAIYTGHAYSGWHTGRRSIEHFTLAQHIGVDLDCEDERSTIDAVLQNDFFRMYGGMVHTSPSHTPKTPRCRVLFFLDQPIVDATAFQAAAKFVVSLFPGADTSVTDASRFFYGAKDCQIEFNEYARTEVAETGILPLAHLRTYYARVQTHKTRNIAGRVKVARKTAPATLPARTVQTPTAQADEWQKVQAALAKVDPYGMDYNRWIGIIAAMKREFGDTALPSVVQWAKGKPGEVEREWERLKIDRANGMGMGTLFALAHGTIH